MSDISAIAAQATHNAAEAVATEVATRTLKLANEQQQVVATLLEDAVEVAAQIAEAGQGQHVDTFA
ncbi:MAG: hypothetical protein KKB50_13490 [Planctomycetes bacterium]|nr:hypothetical protein [Planctomycetota bacterium]